MEILIAAFVAPEDEIVMRARFKALLDLQPDHIILIIGHVAQEVDHRFNLFAIGFVARRLLARVEQHGAILAGCRAGEKQGELGKLGREKRRDIGKKDADKIKAVIFLIAPAFARQIAQLGDRTLRKADPDIGAKAFIMGDVRRRTRINGFGVQRLEMIAFKIAVERDFPVRALNHAAAEKGPILEPGGLIIIEQCTIIGGQID